MLLFVSVSYLLLLLMHKNCPLEVLCFWRRNMNTVFAPSPDAKAAAESAAPQRPVEAREQQHGFSKLADNCDVITDYKPPPLTATAGSAAAHSLWRVDLREGWKDGELKEDVIDHLAKFLVHKASISNNDDVYALFFSEESIKSHRRADEEALKEGESPPFSLDNAHAAARKLIERAKAEPPEPPLTPAESQLWQCTEPKVLDGEAKDGEPPVIKISSRRSLIRTDEKSSELIKLLLARYAVTRRMIDPQEAGETKDTLVVLDLWGAAQSVALAVANAGSRLWDHRFAVLSIDTNVHVAAFGSLRTQQAVDRAVRVTLGATEITKRQRDSATARMLRNETVQDADLGVKVRQQSSPRCGCDPLVLQI
jgi:hypothetical protein